MTISTVTMASLSSALLAASFCSAIAAGDRDEWFESLKMPGTNASCCDLADCESTDADWRNGEWWAVVDGKWRPMPQSRVLTNPRSIDGAAYVCTGSPGWRVGGPVEPPIYCFVPPNWPA
jgi:hypothetical protein